MRSSLSLLAPLLLLAACHGSAPRAPVAGGGTTITIGTARSADYDAWRLDDQGTLPAISDDGTAVAALFHDAVDFIGTPVDTLVIWRIADGQELGRVQLTGPVPTGDDPGPDDAALEQAARARAAEATAALARHRWLRAAGPPSTPDDAADDAADGGDGDDDEDARRRVTLGDGRVLRADAEGRLVLDGATLAPAQLPALGSMAEDMTDQSGACGEVVGLRVLAGGRAGDDWVLVEPDANLGGDSCFGSLGVDTVAFVRIRG